MLTLLTGHTHTWRLIIAEQDAFGVVRLLGCSCGAQRYDPRPLAA
jgi:hypothetical protein